MTRWIGAACATPLVVVSAALAGAPVQGDHIGTLRFADAAGKTVALDEPGVLYVVDFWALGCKPCVWEMPALDRLSKEYEPGGMVRIVGVVWGEWKSKDLPKIAKQVGTTRPVYADSQHWFDNLAIRSFPTKVFIRDGVVVRVTHGASEDSYDVLKTLIEAEVNPTKAKWE